MQVDTLTEPASSAVLAEVPVSVTPLLPSQPSDNSSVPPSASESSEVPTFHVMQPPAQTSAPTTTAVTNTITNDTPTGISIPSESMVTSATNPSGVPTTGNNNAEQSAEMNLSITPAPAALATTTTTTPTTNTGTKQTKRGSRSSQNNKNAHRSPGKPATLLARPSINKTSTILPQPQKTVLLSNQMTPLVPKPVTTNCQVGKTTAPTNSGAGFTTYLVVDGNQGQLVQVANDGQKPVTFRNQAGQILQATPITVVSAANQPVMQAFATNVTNAAQINGFNQQQTSLTSLTPQQSHQNSTPTVTTVRTNSSVDLQRTSLTSDTNSATNQQMSGITQIPATGSILNGCNIVQHQPSLLQPNPPILTTSILNTNGAHIMYDRDVSPGHHDNDSSLDENHDVSITQDGNQSLSLSQLARKANHRQRRSSSSSLSKKKRGRPRLYERDPFTNKPIKSRPMPEGNELMHPNMTTTTTTLLMPGPTSNTNSTFNTIHSLPNGCTTSLIFPNQSMNHTTTTAITTANPSLLQQQTYSYPSLLNGNAPTNSMLSAPTLNIFGTSNNHSSMTSAYPYTSTSTSILPPSSLTGSSLSNQSNLPNATPSLLTAPTSLPSTPSLATVSVPPSPSISRPLMTPLTHTIENQATIPLKNLQISSSSSPMTSSPRHSTTTTPTTTTNPNNTTAVPSVAPLNPSPIKSLNTISSNNDVVVHYIGGFVIRESSRPFPLDDHRDEDRDQNMKDLNLSNGKEKENTSFNDDHCDLGSDQLRCVSCRKIEFSERFYNQEKRICSRACATKPAKPTKINNTKKSLNEKSTFIQETVRHLENSHPPVPAVEIPIEEPVSLPPDHGLPSDPSKWTVQQVGDFIARLTNDTIREVFFESEMDGQALLLMTQEHLRDTMKIKLGPSLIIASEITKLRERARTFSI